MRIQLNGDPRDLPQPLTVQALLAELDIDPRAVAVEVNRVVVKRARYADTVIGDGDEVEVVAFVGGGANAKGRRQKEDKRGAGCEVRGKGMTGNPALSTRHQRRRLSGWVLVLMLAATPIAAQRGRGAAANDEAALLAPGWTALAAGDAAGAGATAARVLGQFPNSAAALVLLVDADIARGGAIVALGAYESWLGARRLDDAYVLRRIARAALRQEMLGKDAAPRLQAMRGLASDGDLEAIGLLNDAAAQGRLTETLELARLGQDRAVLSLIKQLESPLSNRRAIIEALGQSRSALAAPPLVKLVGDANEDTQALAADALGKLGARETAGSIRPLLADEKKPFHVRFAAAGALHRLGDPTGTVFLRGLLDASTHSLVRIQAAESLMTVPNDTSVLPVVRSLASDPDPVVRIGAARILAPYDQPLAQSLLEAAGQDPNPSVRELASQALATRVAGDFASLRRLLRSTDAVSRVAAGARILELTR